VNESSYIVLVCLLFFFASLRFQRLTILCFKNSQRKMRFSAFLTLAVTTATSSACTFSVASDQANDSAGGGTFECSLSIQPKNRDNPIGPPYGGFNKNIECGQGCDTVSYRGRTWKFCHTGLSPWGYDLNTPKITVQEMDNDGNELSIAPPDGKSSHESGEGAFSSWEQNNWWRAGIHC
jgi:uncharacterized membrane protein